VLLGIRAAPKERAGVSAAEAVYGKLLALPGQFWPAAEVEARPKILLTVKPAEGPEATPAASSDLVLCGGRISSQQALFMMGHIEYWKKKTKLCWYRWAKSRIGYTVNLPRLRTKYKL
jgi:hypothetical protein